VIFVIMGMEVHPFDRLARAVDELQRTGGAGDDFLVQLGACTYEPVHARFVRYLSFGEVCEHVRSSSAVITHAGAGSTLTCLEEGKHPIMVPRRAQWGEHVDDHQVPFTRKFAEQGLATAVYEVAELSAAIAAVRGKSGPGHVIGGATDLTRWLEGFWQGLEPGAGARQVPPRRAIK
jgi:UDP-N-acetylglucosamine transferase subunit ALG13